MSTKRHIRRQQCTGKKRWDSWALAQMHCNAEWKRGQKMRPYACKFCPYIHVGPMSRELKASLRSRS